jgi:phosphate starvation-inducible PhoH-like protein
MAFAVGPAGTGKSHSAIGIALSAYRQKAVSKIIICRPAVEAGEALGYLPGSAEEKLRPYLIPIFDAIESIYRDKSTGPNAVKTITNGPDIEVVAFAHLRGRTFQDAFIVVDEAQNATMGQLEMVMTRLGEGSKMIITGDPAQSDLKIGMSGLPTVLRLLEGSEEIPIINFTEEDNLRHPIVAYLTKMFSEHHTKNPIKVK